MAECSVLGCDENIPGVWFELDERGRGYKRCDQKGCDEYSAEVTASGMFTIYELRGRATLLKMAKSTGMFVDVATSGVSAFVNSGTCQPLR